MEGVTRADLSSYIRHCSHELIKDPRQWSFHWHLPCCSVGSELEQNHVCDYLFWVGERDVNRQTCHVHSQQRNVSIRGAVMCLPTDTEFAHGGGHFLSCLKCRRGKQCRFLSSQVLPSIYFLLHHWWTVSSEWTCSLFTIIPESVGLIEH